MNIIFIGTYIQNSYFLQLVLNLGINIANLWHILLIDQRQSVNMLKFQKVSRRNEFNREWNVYT